MAQVRVPPNVSSVTLVTSGIVVPAAGIITCTAVEATDLASPYSKGAETSGIIDSAATTVRLKMPASITSITINGAVTAVVAGVTANIAAADAANFLFSRKMTDSMFQLVSG